MLPQPVQHHQQQQAHQAGENAYLGPLVSSCATVQNMLFLPFLQDLLPALRGCAGWTDRACLVQWVFIIWNYHQCTTGVVQGVFPAASPAQHTAASHPGGLAADSGHQNGYHQPAMQGPCTNGYGDGHMGEAGSAPSCGWFPPADQHTGQGGPQVDAGGAVPILANNGHALGAAMNSLSISYASTDGAAWSLCLLNGCLLSLQ